MLCWGGKSKVNCCVKDMWVSLLFFSYDEKYEMRIENLMYMSDNINWVPYALINAKKKKSWYGLFNLAAQGVN
jgi:hypothetical protein